MVRLGVELRRRPIVVASTPVHPRLRRLLVAGVVLGAVLTVVVVVEVQLARSGPRLEDEKGARPKGLVIGPDRPGPTLHIVWLGDSTTTGVGVEDFADSMAFHTSEDASEVLSRPVSLTVLGVSGAQVHEVVDEQVAGIADIPADVVVISVGANDVTHLTRRPPFRSNFRKLLDRVAELAPEAEVVVVGIPDMGSVPRFEQPLRSIAGLRASQLNDDVRSAARDATHQYADLADETGPLFRRDPERYFAGDQFHPSISGHALWAEAARGEVIAAAVSSVD